MGSAGITIAKKVTFLVVTSQTRVFLPALAPNIAVGITNVSSSYRQRHAASRCQSKKPWYFPLIYIKDFSRRPMLRKTTLRLTRTVQ